MGGASEQLADHESRLRALEGRPQKDYAPGAGPEGEQKTEDGEPKPKKRATKKTK